MIWNKKKKIEILKQKSVKNLNNSVCFAKKNKQKIFILLIWKLFNSNDKEDNKSWKEIEIKLKEIMKKILKRVNKNP